MSVTWRQGKVNTSTGIVDSNNHYAIITEKNDIPLGAYRLCLPHVAIDFKKVTNGVTSDVSYSNVTRYIFFYDANGLYLGYQSVSSETYDFTDVKMSTARKYIFQCSCSSSSYQTYPEEPEPMTGTYYYMNYCSFYFDVKEFNKVNGIWLSADSNQTILNTIEQPIPLSYWRIDRYHNDGNPWHERLLDISYNPPVEALYKPPIKYTIVTEDETEIYSSNNIDKYYGVIDPVLTLEDSSTNSLQFKIPPDHYFYNKIERLKTKCRVFRNGVEIFEGRVVSETLDFYDRRDVLFEGALAYLNDTHQPQREYSYYTVIQIVEAILDVHNSKVDASRQIEIGVISVTESYPRKDYYWYTQYESTLTSIQNLAEAVNAHIRVRKNAETGKRVLDIFQEMNEVSKQQIIFGSNLSDFTRTFDMGELVTVLLPLGKHTSDNDDIGNQLTPKSYGGDDTPAWEKYHYETDGNHSSESGIYMKSLYLNTDIGETGDEEDYGARIVCADQETTGPAYNQQYVWWLNVEPGQVFYLTSSLHTNMDHEVYHYSVRDVNGFQLLSKGAGTQSGGEAAINTITKEKIECPVGSAVMMISGIVGNDAYPVELYESRQLPDEMESYVTIEKCPEVTYTYDGETRYEHEADSLYLIARPRTIITYDQNHNEIETEVDPFTEWGYVEKTIEFDDVEDEDDLYSKAKAYLEEYQYDQMKIELNAIDAKVLGVDTDDIFLYQNIRCISPKHGLDHLFPVTKLTINLSNPSNNKISLNSSNERSFTQNSSSINDKLFNKIAKAGEKSKTIEAAKKNAYNLIKNSNTGIVSLNTDPNTGYVTSITVSCDPTWRESTKYWIWNEGGMAYIDEEGHEVVVGMTNDGRVICNELAANSVISGASLTNKLFLGATDTDHPGEMVCLAPKTGGNTWPSMEINAGQNSVDGHFGKLASYTEPLNEVEPDRFLQYYFEILNGKTVYGYRYVNASGVEQARNNRLIINTVPVDGTETPRIEAPETDLIIKCSNNEIQLESHSLYFNPDGNIYVRNGDDEYGVPIYNTGVTDTLTIGSKTLYFVKGIYCGYEEN